MPKVYIGLDARKGEVVPKTGQGFKLLNILPERITPMPTKRRACSDEFKALKAQQAIAQIASGRSSCDSARRSVARICCRRGAVAGSWNLRKLGKQSLTLYAALLFSPAFERGNFLCHVASLKPFPRNS